MSAERSAGTLRNWILIAPAAEQSSFKPKLFVFGRDESREIQRDKSTRATAKSATIRQIFVRSVSAAWFGLFFVHASFDYASMAKRVLDEQCRADQFF